MERRPRVREFFQSDLNQLLSMVARLFFQLADLPLHASLDFLAPRGSFGAGHLAQ
jgi:hypothetical protein